MTIEELQKQLQELTVQLTEERAKNTTLSNNQSQQNSYITKLEEKINKMETAISNASNAVNTTDLNSPAMDYVRKFMRKNVEEEGYAKCKSMVTPEQYATLEKELKDFVKAYMNETNLSVEYMVDAFNLIYGRALNNHEHGIHAIGKSTQPTTTPPTNVKSLSEMKELFTAPQMTTVDNSASSDLPGSQPSTANIRNTDEAMKAFRNRLTNMGANRFQ